MKLVICLDEKNGINFNKRRQTMDIRQREDLLKLVDGEKLFLKKYSYDLYKDMSFNFEVVEKFGDEEGYYLFEEKVPSEFLEKVDTLICYFWNRRYPFDDTFNEHNSSNWIEVERKSFDGYSHEEITRVIYKRY